MAAIIAVMEFIPAITSMVYSLCCRTNGITRINDPMWIKKGNAFIGTSGKVLE